MGGTGTGTPITVTTNAIDTLTVLKIVTEAMEELGLLAPGETPNYDEIDFGIRKLNRMLNSWAADGIALHCRAEDTKTLVVSTGSYTIGPAGATITSSRPQVIEQAFIRDSDGYDHEIEIRPIAEYWKLTDKDVAGRPDTLYYDTTPSYGTIYLYPVPDTAESLHLISQKPFTNVTAQSDEISLPPEYQEAIISSLAVYMAPAYGKAVSAELAAINKHSRSLLRQRNLANQMKSVTLNISGAARGFSRTIEEG